MGAAICVRYLIFFFNLIFALVGLAILVVGGISQYYASQGVYSQFMNETLVYVPIILLVIGAIITIVAFFGCCGAFRESHWMVTVFGSLLILLLILEVAVAVLAFVYHGDIIQSIETKMQQGVDQYYKDEAVQKMIDGIQLDATCCGVKGPDDWHGHVPNSCCNLSSPQAECSDPYSEGCLVKLENFVNSTGYALGYGVLAVFIVQVLGIIFAFYLARTIKKGYEIV